MTVRVELVHSTDSFSELERITKEARDKLKVMLGLDAKIMLVSPNTLERFEGKAKRVKDLRSSK
jgi:phenylacetate-CoA ligase